MILPPDFPGFVGFENQRCCLFLKVRDSKALEAGSARALHTLVSPSLLCFVVPLFSPYMYVPRSTMCAYYHYLADASLLPRISWQISRTVPALSTNTACYSSSPTPRAGGSLALILSLSLSLAFFFTPALPATCTIRRDQLWVLSLPRRLLCCSLGRRAVCVCFVCLCVCGGRLSPSPPSTQLATRVLCCVPDAPASSSVHAA